MRFLNSIKPPFYYGFSWVINLLVVLIFFGAIDVGFYKVYFNSDALYIQSLYRDIFVDGNGLKGWYLNAAPNFFPDFIIYSAINSIVKDFRLSSVVYSIFQYTTILLLINFILFNLFKKSGFIINILVNSIFPFLLYTGIFFNAQYFSFQILSLGYHTGFILNTLLVFVLFLKYFENENRSLLIALFAVSILGALNDKLFIFSVSLPALILIILNFFLRRKHIFLSCLSLLSGTIIGVVVYEIIKSIPEIVFANMTGKFFLFEKAIRSVAILKDLLLKYLLGFNFRSVIVVFLITSIILFVVWIFKTLVKKSILNYNQNNDSFRKLIFKVFLGFSLFFCLFLPVFNGFFLGLAHIRYIYYAFIVSMFFPFLYLRNSFLSSKLFKILYVLLIFLNIGLLTSVLINRSVVDNFSEFVNLYPEEVRVIDEFAEKNGLEYGVSTYWPAKFTTMFSQNNVKVYPVINNEFKIWYHVLNKNWFYCNEKGEKPTFKFYITKGFNVKKVEQNFGPFLDSLHVDGSVVLYELSDFYFEEELRKPVGK